MIVYALLKNQKDYGSTYVTVAIFSEKRHADLFLKADELTYNDDFKVEEFKVDDWLSLPLPASPEVG